MADLVVAPCDYQAAKYAVMNWHYSKRMPAGELVKFGAWENGKFIGVVLFGRGANKESGKEFGLKNTQVCELVRIALKEHRSTVTRIFSKSRQLLKSNSNCLRLIVSYADTAQGHEGKIYQASNWFYVGGISHRHYIVNGEKMHSRSVSARYGTRSIPWLKNNVDSNCKLVGGDVKYKYLYPLDKAMRRQIEPLAKPYPKTLECADVG